MLNRSLIILVVMVLVVGISGCSQTPSQKDVADAKIDEILTVGSTTYQVNAINPMDTITIKEGPFGGPAKIAPDDPSLLFFDVELTLTNLTDTAVTTQSYITALTGGDGKEYPHLGEPRDLSFEASAPTKIRVTFVVKRDAIDGACLTVKDLFSDLTGVIALVSD